MQTLAFEIANTFVEDAAALIGGCGRIIVQILLAPIERLANACDVGGVLANRRFSHLTKGARPKQPGQPGPRRTQRRSCHWLLGSLGDLT